MLLFLYGHGANGKSVFVELMNWLLGDYANKNQTEMLMKHQRNPGGASPEIVALKGLRFAYANQRGGAIG
jgi:putative DNA primase/helicase